MKEKEVPTFRGNVNKADVTEKGIAKHYDFAVYELEEPITLTVNGSGFKVVCTHCSFNSLAGIPVFGYLQYNGTKKSYELGRYTVNGFDGTGTCCIKEEAAAANEAYNKAVKHSPVSNSGLNAPNI